MGTAISIWQQVLIRLHGEPQLERARKRETEREEETEREAEREGDCWAPRMCKAENVGESQTAVKLPYIQNKRSTNRADVLRAMTDPKIPYK